MNIISNLLLLTVMTGPCVVVVVHGKPRGSGKPTRTGQVKRFEITSLDDDGIQDCNTEIILKMFDDTGVQHFKAPHCEEEEDGGTTRRGLKGGGGGGGSTAKGKKDKGEKGKKKAKKKKGEIGGSDGDMTLSLRREDNGRLAASINDFDNKVMYHLSGNEATGDIRVREVPIENMVEEEDAIKEDEVLQERKLQDDFDAAIKKEEVERQASSVIKPGVKSRLGAPSPAALKLGIDPNDLQRQRQLKNDDSGDELDIMVVWTRKAECSYSNNLDDDGPGCTSVDQDSYEDMMALVNLAIQETNEAFIGSGVPTQLRLVHAYRHPTYVESNGGDELRDITPYYENNSAYNYQPDIAETRDDVGADIVAFLIHKASFCGKAWVNTQHDVLNRERDWMYSVTHWTCATGYYTFGHELGHNFGCNHDRGTKDTCNSDLNNYNYGYRNPNAEFRSILGYNCDSSKCDVNKSNCLRVPRYSNTYQNYDELPGIDLPIGTARSDCARTITESLPYVAAYKTSIIDDDPPTISPRPTVSPMPTPSPTTPSPTPQYSLTLLTNNQPDFSYGICEGDCDEDKDCFYGLVCQQRDGGEDVPGCAGSDPGASDYCRFPLPNELVLMGDNGSPSAAFPLQECQGDCDGDGDCDDGLLCYGRNGVQSVTGCIGEGQSGKDYCYCPDPNGCNLAPTPSPTPNPTSNPTPSPSPQPTTNPTPQPTPTPTQNPTPEPTVDPTPEPTPNPTKEPTPSPTDDPTPEPTPNPTPQPTDEATPAPSMSQMPSKAPTPTNSPTPSPTSPPTKEPTPSPTQDPTPSPTNEPTTSPTTNPTSPPTKPPTSLPTTEPTPSPTNEPTTSPTPNPTSPPTKPPTPLPTTEPTPFPTNEPTTSPTPIPTAFPTKEPTPFPTQEPTPFPTSPPTTPPTGAPSASDCTGNAVNACGWVEDSVTGQLVPGGYSICVYRSDKKDYRSECYETDELVGKDVGYQLNGDDSIAACGCCGGDDDDMCVNTPTCVDDSAHVCDEKDGFVKTEYCYFDAKKKKYKEKCENPLKDLKGPFQNCGQCS